MPNPPTLWFRWNKAAAYGLLAVALVLVGAKVWGWATAAGSAAFLFGGLAWLESRRPQPGLGHTYAARTAVPPGSPPPPPSEALGSEKEEPSIEAVLQNEGGEMEAEDPTVRLHALLSEESDAHVLEALPGLLEQGASLSDTNEDSWNALEIAVNAQAGLDVCEALVAKGARVQPDTTLLSEVIANNGSVDLVRLLLSNGSSADDESSDCASLVEQALEEEADEGIVLALLEGATAFVQTNESEDWAYLAVKQSASALVMETILARAASLGETLSLARALLLALEEDNKELSAVLLAAGVSPFEYSEEDENFPVRYALENTGMEMVRQLALACVGRDRYRLQGWAEANEEFLEEEPLKAWLRILEQLEQRWGEGYGDPRQPAMFLEGLPGEGLNRSLLQTTQAETVQALLLAGANPFWAPQEKALCAFEQACQKADGQLVAMLLETQSDTEADYRLGTLPHPDTTWVREARAELALRRTMRQRVVEALQAQT